MPKKRNSGDGGLYPIRGGKLWRGVVDIGFTADGRREQKYVHARTQRAAREKLEALKSEIREFGAPLDRQTTVAQWSEHWLETVARRSYKPNALAATESFVRVWIVPTIGRKRVATVKPSDVREVLQAVQKAGRSTSTARRVYDCLSLMLESARRDGLASRNVADDVTKPAVRSKERGALTVEQGMGLLRAAADEPNGSRWWVTLLSGIRQGERLGAQLASLDLENGTLGIDWALDEISSEHGCGEKATNGSWPCGKKRGASCSDAQLKIPDGFEYRRLSGRLCLIRPKNGKPRSTPLIAPVVEALRRHVEATAHLPNPHGLIWRHEDGSPFLPGEDQQAWRDLLFSAGVIDAEQRKAPRERAPGTVEPPTTHWARHTTATMLMELGVHPRIIAEIVGHLDERTQARYQHVSSPAAREAAEMLGARFAEALERGAR